ncbi:NAD-dependent epimerase/dehydratase family protein [Enterococcus casseliflavus]|uniref:NAD-dependent epimerase/dehydratase family protein n=1 Tax=Enterococcus casseliflavus TaxID=37734 RepID=UPI003A4C8398
MINILITGENSYIGRKFIEYISEFPNQYTIESISVRGDGWKEKSFGKYDSVIHVAGIAHKKNIEKSLYYSVNKDLSKSVAQKAKEDGVHQFIYLSSMAVFGKDKGIIDKNTKTSPKDNYGKSKLLAEGELFALETNNFQVAVVRPPMVYGENAPGNYQKLCKLSRFILFFPDSKNTRSMIFIDNLSKLDV